MTATMPPPVRRIVTGHDAAGRSIVQADRVARMAFVLLDAKPATVDGAPLPELSPRAGLSRS